GVDYVAILGILMGVGASVARNGLESELWVMGIMALVLLVFVLQLTTGELLAEWDSHYSWKQNCDQASGSVDLSVKRLPDGRLVNITEKEESRMETLILGVGMIATEFHWVGLPLTVLVLGLRRWIVNGKEQR
nr:non-structural protein 2B [Modoc virus]